MVFKKKKAVFIVFECKGKTEHQRTEKASEVMLRDFSDISRYELVWATWLVLQNKEISLIFNVIQKEFLPIKFLMNKFHHTDGCYNVQSLVSTALFLLG